MTERKGDKWEKKKKCWNAKKSEEEKGGMTRAKEGERKTPEIVQLRASLNIQNQQLQQPSEGDCAAKYSQNLLHQAAISRHQCTSFK